MKYRVTITEHKTSVFEVEADTEWQAHDLAHNQLDDSEAISVTIDTETDSITQIKG